MQSPFRAKTPDRSVWRTCVLLLSVGLLALAMLAKHSFSQPRSSGTHWISQTCKILEGRRSAPVRARLEAAIKPVRQDRYCSDRQVAFNDDEPPFRTPDFFSSAALRSPPSLL